MLAVTVALTFDLLCEITVASSGFSQLAGMSRHCKTDVNPDLAKERLSASFDPEQLTFLLDGGDWLTSLRREMGNYSPTKCCVISYCS